MSDTHPAFATCPRGIESLLLEEIRALGADNVRETIGGVYFDADMPTLYRICLWDRLANRVLLPLVQFPVDSADALYDGVRTVDWNEHVPAQGSITVDFNGTNTHVRNTQFGAVRTKDAVVDIIRDRFGARPTVERDEPDVRINVHLKRGHATVAIDLSGESLHRRGYRRNGGGAPLKENLAAAILTRAGWPEISARNGALVDPMCGSGTFLIEGVQMARGIAPRLDRPHWGFSGWLGHVPATWNTAHGEAREESDERASNATPPAFGYDASGKALAIARDNVERAGLTDHIFLRRRELAEFTQPTHQKLQPGLVVTNPPYGERLGEENSLRHLYEYLGTRLVSQFDGWDAAVITGNPELGKAMRLRAHHYYKVFNGPIESRLLLFKVAQDARTQARAGATNDSSTTVPTTTLSDGGQMFANRLRKNVKRLSKWRKRSGVTCYRLYDADMPEYSLALDMYGDWAHVAEYQAPRTIDPNDAAKRLDEALVAVAQVLEIPQSRVVVKRRERQRGAKQYERKERREEFMEVSEGPARLLVNLHDFLDTGLFVDHRKVRESLAETAKGGRFLNLFCYTASATIHAALGGAQFTTSVDSSATYLAWARRNIALNGLSESRNRLVRADVREWLADGQDSYDLIFLDPPTFSNSKGADNFDLERDHGALVCAAMERLSPNGTLVFSTNKRDFKLDPGLGDRFSVTDKTQWSIDEDFRNGRRPHQCWFLTLPVAKVRVKPPAAHIPEDDSAKGGPGDTDSSVVDAHVVDSPVADSPVADSPWGGSSYNGPPTIGSPYKNSLYKGSPDQDSRDNDLPSVDVADIETPKDDSPWGRALAKKPNVWGKKPK
jgi:23S rRNA (guanine2445-N2)-methyltransferase / 23S rRNA (guanine2069-N7)-methyltransferase